jgi:hypothetical protein
MESFEDESMIDVSEMYVDRERVKESGLQVFLREEFRKEFKDLAVEKRKY